MPPPLKKSKGFCPRPPKISSGGCPPAGERGAILPALSRLTERNVLPAGQNPPWVGAGLCKGKTVL